MARALNGTTAERPKLSIGKTVCRNPLENAPAESRLKVLTEPGQLANSPGEPNAGQTAPALDLAEPPQTSAVPAAATAATPTNSEQSPLPNSAPDPVVAAAAALQALPPPALVPAPAAPLPWSDEDESAFQGLAARRKAAGYQRRGRNVDDQLIAPGTIKPNPNTVVAVIVGLVSERGEARRAKLIDAMKAAAFPHPKAQPDDRGWCQGYITGAIRDGFLALVEHPDTAVQLAA